MDKVFPGDGVEIPARVYNDNIDSTDQSKRSAHSLQQRPSTGPRDAHDLVQVENNTGAARARFETVQLAGLLTTLPKPPYLGVLGITPTDGAQCYAVLQEPLARAAIGAACISGLTAALVNVQSDTDCRCAPSTGDHVLLSSSCGPIPIVWKPPGATGVQLCVVLLTDPCLCAERDRDCTPPPKLRWVKAYDCINLGSTTGTAKVQRKSSGGTYEDDPAYASPVTIDNSLCRVFALKDEIFLAAMSGDRCCGGSQSTPWIPYGEFGLTRRVRIEQTIDCNSSGTAHVLKETPNYCDESVSEDCPITVCNKSNRALGIDAQEDVSATVLPNHCRFTVSAAPRALLAKATASAKFCVSTSSVTVTGFAVKDVCTWAIKSTVSSVKNPGLAGCIGDNLTLIWLEATHEWEIVQVKHHEVDKLLSYILPGDGCQLDAMYAKQVAIMGCGPGTCESVVQEKAIDLFPMEMATGLAMTGGGSGSGGGGCTLALTTKTVCVLGKAGSGETHYGSGGISGTILSAVTSILDGNNCLSVLAKPICVLWAGGSEPVNAICHPNCDGTTGGGGGGGGGGGSPSLSFQATRTEDSAGQTTLDVGITSPPAGATSAVIKIINAQGYTLNSSMLGPTATSWSASCQNNVGGCVNYNIGDTLTVQIDWFDGGATLASSTQTTTIGLPP